MFEWTPGSKHPLTLPLIFRNLWYSDRVRKVLKGRCAVCDHVVSEDEKAVREVLIKCGKKDCGCSRTLSPILHPVCDVCYAMWHSLYHNYCMKDMNYFKRWDEIEERRRDDEKGNRRRMGLE